MRDCRSNCRQRSTSPYRALPTPDVHAPGAGLAEADRDLPGVELHPSQGDLEGFRAVSVSGAWRIIFRFVGGRAYDVDSEDHPGWRREGRGSGRCGLCPCRSSPPLADVGADPLVGEDLEEHGVLDPPVDDMRALHTGLDRVQGRLDLG